jgi:endonuclease-3
MISDAEVERFFATLAAANPDPLPELQYSSVFELLVAVMLSAQATDAGVNKATPALFARAPSAQAMLALGLEEITQHIRSIGLYRTKARNLLQTCALLVERHDGEVPHSRQALDALPGVGRKTANVVLNVAFGEPTIAVDTHVFRVANRSGLAPGRNPLQVEQLLLRRVPAAYLQHAHHWLILHGRYVCLARRPLCESCRVSAWCEHAWCEHGRNLQSRAQSARSPQRPPESP